MMHVNVKWGKELLKDVEVDVDQPPLVLKSQLFTLTGVAPDRQKVMVKSKLLKDDEWGPIQLKDGQTIMMMGSVGAVPVAPQKEIVFIEDLPEDEQDIDNMGQYGAGLKNLGNTCYMNSTLQCLYSVPELRRSLINYQGDQGGGLNPGRQLTLAAGHLFKDLERSAAPVMPLNFWKTLRTMFPQFAEMGEGGYKQQDAEECWSQVMSALRQELRLEDGGSRTPVIDKLFGIHLHTELSCKESGEKIVTEGTELKLQCNISSDPPVRHLHEGLAQGLKANREQTSEKLGKNVLFEGSQQIAELPPYLVVQIVRFCYKTNANVKAKILKKVGFPISLDLHDFCTDALKKQLEAPRELVKEQRNKETAQMVDAKQTVENEATSSAPDPATPVGEKSKQEDSPQDADGDTPMMEASASGSSSHPDAAKEAFTGAYELLGVLTHKGRSADSGHYVAWTRGQDGQWIEFDDDELIRRTEDEIKNLDGGGDWHMAYLLLFEAKKVKTK